jgi:hypothetical protein
VIADDGKRARDAAVARPARRTVGAYCEVVATDLICGCFRIATMSVCIWGYGVTGVLAWAIVHAAWARARRGQRLRGWATEGDPMLVGFAVGGFLLQHWLNGLEPHAGDAVFVAMHFMVLTSAVRADPFPRAKLVSTSSCSSG